ncbi:hypothetical protein MXB_3718, partial [Myxobolus squamalis]
MCDINFTIPTHIVYMILYFSVGDNED